MQPANFTCSRCQAPLPAGVVQCPNCGLAFSAPVPAGPAPGLAPQQKSRGPGMAIVIGIVALFVLVFVVAMLAAILFPVFAQAREKARIISSSSNLKIISLAVEQYAQDHNEHYPPTDSMDHFRSALTPYLQDNKSKGLDLFDEPGYNQPYVLNPKLSGIDAEALANPSATVLAAEPVQHPGGVRVMLYADGTVRSNRAGDQ